MTFYVSTEVFSALMEKSEINLIDEAKLQKKHQIKVNALRFIVAILILVFWEIFTKLKIIDPYLKSLSSRSPSDGCCPVGAQVYSLPGWGIHDSW